MKTLFWICVLAISSVVIYKTYCIEREYNVKLTLSYAIYLYRLHCLTHGVNPLVNINEISTDYEAKGFCKYEDFLPITKLEIIYPWLICAEKRIYRKVRGNKND